MRILVAEPIAAEGVAKLRAEHEVDERHDALVVRSQVQVDAAVIAAAGNRLQVVGRAGVGVDNVDLEAATAAGITVVNAPTGNTIAAAEHTLALLYGVARKIAAADASVRRGEWKRAQFTGLELRGRTLGIVGLGKIGQAIAVRAVAMEMVVLASDPYVSEEQAAHFGVELVPFDRLVERSDVITVHVPLTRTTRGLIGRDQIARMKRGAILLNVARGGILDEAAVAEALAAGQLAGAGVDVFDAEPPVGSPLLDAPNTLLTPHLGASTAEAQVLVAEEVADQVLDVLAGRSARYAVNAPLLTPETARAIAPYLPLAEMLGRFFAQFARSGVRTVTLEIAGELAAFDASPLTAAVLRGMIETSTTQRVNLVNAAALAKARGITVVERKTPDAGSYAAQISLSGESGGRITTVAGTIAGGELRLTRLDAGDDRPDRPDARRGRRQHQRDARRAERAASRRPDDPGPRRRRRPGGRRGDPQPRLGDRAVDDPPGAGPLTPGDAPGDERATAPPVDPDPDALDIPVDLDATLVLVRHGESELIAQRRFQGQLETPLSATGRRQAALVARRLARPHDRPALPLPAGPPLAIVHSPLARAAETATAIGDAAAAPEAFDRTLAIRADARFIEIGQGDWEGLLAADIGARDGERLAAWRRTPTLAWAPGGERLIDVRRRVVPGLADLLVELAAAGRPGSIDAPQGLPLERFWMWSSDLCGITVLEIRAGRPVVRAMNLTEHLASLLDEDAQAEMEARTRSGAL